MRFYRSLLIITIFIELSGCRSKFDKSKKEDEVPEGDSVPTLPSTQMPTTVVDEEDAPLGVPDSETAVEEVAPLSIPDPVFTGTFQFLFTYVQSRKPITVLISRDIADDGGLFNLVNETTASTLLDTTATDLLERQLQATSDAFVSYAFYPYSSGHAALFRAGDNDIKLNILDDSRPRYYKSKIVIRDFNLQAPAFAHFSDEIQVKGNFQGWVNLVKSPTVTSGNTMMTTGMQEIFNR